MFPFQKLSSDSDFSLYDAANQRVGGKPISPEFFRQAEVFMWKDRKGLPVAGFLINQQVPFRSVAFARPENQSYLMGILERYKTVELGALWLSKQYWGSWRGLVLWLACAIAAFRSEADYAFVCAHSPQLAKKYALDPRSIQILEELKNGQFHCRYFFGPKGVLLGGVLRLLQARSKSIRKHLHYKGPTPQIAAK